MLLFETDDKLSEDAQRYAETFLETRGLDGNNVSTGDVAITLNLYSFATDDDLKRRSALAILKWELSISKLPKDAIVETVKSYSPTLKDRRLHDFAKLVHAEVWKVGCGVADFNLTNNKFLEVFVCFYGPPKLKEGEQLYIPGCWPCSHCPKGSACTKEEGSAWNAFEDTLCKVNSNDIQTHKKRQHVEEICYTIPPTKVPTEKTTESTPSIPFTSKKSELVVSPTFPSDEGIGPLDGKDMEICREDKNMRICFPGWEYATGSAKIKVEGNCVFATAFQSLFNIQDHSCFEFRYVKLNNASVPSNDGYVIAFVFDAYNKARRLYTRKHEDNQNYLRLNIPWRNAQVHVGFGTLSISPTNKYEVTVSAFSVKGDKCVITS